MEGKHVIITIAIAETIENTAESKSDLSFNSIQKHKYDKNVKIHINLLGIAVVARCQWSVDFESEPDSICGYAMKAIPE